MAQGISLAHPPSHSLQDHHVHGFSRDATLVVITTGHRGSPIDNSIYRRGSGRSDRVACDLLAARRHRRAQPPRGCTTQAAQAMCPPAYRRAASSACPHTASPGRARSRTPANTTSERGRFESCSGAYGAKCIVEGMVGWEGRGAVVAGRVIVCVCVGVCVCRGGLAV